MNYSVNLDNPYVLVSKIAVPVLTLPKEVGKCLIYFSGVWTSDAMHSNAILEIGKKLKERLRIAPKVVIGYQVHKDTMDKASSATKNSYTV